MPYYIYRIFPFHRLEKVAVHEAFSPASTQAKALRKELTQPADCRVKVIFAENELSAETLLTEVREDRPHIAEDD